MRAAQAALIKYAHRMNDLSKHRQHHADLADELEQELMAREGERETLIAAANASTDDQAERERLWRRVEAIDPDFFS